VEGGAELRDFEFRGRWLAGFGGGGSGGKPDGSGGGLPGGVGKWAR